MTTTVFINIKLLVYLIFGIIQFLIGYWLHRLLVVMPEYNESDDDISTRVGVIFCFIVSECLLVVAFNSCVGG